MANAGVDRSCAATVGGSDVAGRGWPVAVGGYALPGVRGRVGVVGRLSAAGAGRPREVQAACPAGVLPGVRADACAVAGVFARAPVGRGRRGRVRAGDGGRGSWVSPDRGCVGVAVLDGAWVAATAAGRGRMCCAAGSLVSRSRWPSRRPARRLGSLRPLGLLVRAIADAFLAARLRLGPGAVRGGVWAFCSAATSGRVVGQHERALGSAPRAGQAAAL